MSMAVWIGTLGWCIACLTTPRTFYDGKAATLLFFSIITVRGFSDHRCFTRHILERVTQHGGEKVVGYWCRLDLRLSIGLDCRSGFLFLMITVLIIIVVIH